MTGPRAEPAVDPVEEYLRAKHARDQAGQPGAPQDTDPVAAYLAARDAHAPARDNSSVAAGMLAQLGSVIPGWIPLNGAVAGSVDALGNLLHGQPANFGQSVRDETAALRRSVDKARGVAGGWPAAALGAAGMAATLPIGASRAAGMVAEEAAAPAASSLIARVLSGVGRGAVAAGKGAVAGGTAGAVYGAADADGSLADRLKAGVNAYLPSAAGGAVLGAAAGPTLSALARLDEAASPRLTAAGRKALVERATIRSEISPTDRRGLQFLADEVRAGGKDPQSLATAYESGTLPADAPILETGGPRVTNLAAAVRAIGGEGAGKVEQAALAMREGQNARVRGAVRTAFGGEAPPNVVDFAEQLAQERAAQGSPLFEQANRETGLIDNPRFQQLIKTPWGKRMWNEAKMMLAQDEHVLPTIDGATLQGPHAAGQADTPAGVIPDLRAMHYFRMATDNALAHPNEFRVRLDNGEQSGTATTVQRQLQRMRDETTGMLHDASPTFAQADASWADNSAKMRAFKAGQGFATGKTDEIAHVVRGIEDPAHRQLYDAGAQASVENLLADVRDNRDALGRAWETPAIREKYQAALPPDRMAQLTTDMTRAAGQRDLVRRVLGGSQTTDKALTAEALRSDDTQQAAELASHIIHRSPAGLVNWIAKQGTQLRAARIGRETGASVGNYLTSADPQEVLRLVLRYADTHPNAVQGAGTSPQTLQAIARVLGTAQASGQR